MKPTFLIPSYKAQRIGLPLDCCHCPCKHTSLQISEDAGLLGTILFYSWGGGWGWVLHDIFQEIKGYIEAYAKAKRQI